jgi:hypothetical protein
MPAGNVHLNVISTLKSAGNTDLWQACFHAFRALAETNVNLEKVPVSQTGLLAVSDLSIMSSRGVDEKKEWYLAVH